MGNKENIILIGDGAIGSSYAFNCLSLGIGRNIGIIDVNMERVQGDVADLLDALPYTSQKNIYAANYADCKYAGLIVITAGVPQKVGETRLQLINKNAAIVKSITKNIMESGFNGIILIASNPVDVMTQVVLKESGLPKNQVFGSGTALDSARLRGAIGSRFNVDARDVHGYILGEHGDSEFPAWKFVTIGGQPIRQYIGEDRQDILDSIATEVKDAAYSIIQKKGATFYGIAASLTRITAAIINDDRSIFALSVSLDGQYGQQDVCIGVPAVVGANGINKILELELDAVDQQKLADSAGILKDNYAQIQ